jgi:hypothetical protein
MVEGQGASHPFPQSSSTINSTLSLLALCALCTKSVSQLLCNQMDPHSFLKLPGVTPVRTAAPKGTLNKAVISTGINNLPSQEPITRRVHPDSPVVCSPWSLISDHSSLSSVPLHPTSLGATMANSARFLYHPGKQLRSPRCLRIVSGHREPFDDVLGHTPAWPGSQVVPGSSF